MPQFVSRGAVSLAPILLKAAGKDGEVGPTRQPSKFGVRNENLEVLVKRCFARTNAPQAEIAMWPNVEMKFCQPLRDLGQDRRRDLLGDRLRANDVCKNGRMIVGQQVNPIGDLTDFQQTCDVALVACQ